MNFSKVLFFLGAGTAVVRCAEIEQRFVEIQDALRMLPDIEQYLTKMQNATKMYENVFVPLNEKEKLQRIEKAKEKAINFYANILGVNLPEVEKYDENFTTAQYLAWVAKEVINKGCYIFAENDQDLFVRNSTNTLMEKNKDNGKFKSVIEPTDFGTQGAAIFPTLERVPEIWGLTCTYNNPHFESHIVHETGHILDYAYRILTNIHNETANSENESLCSEGVSVFFETLYEVKHDQIFMTERLTDWYGIKFMLSYIEKLGKQRQNAELQTKIMLVKKTIKGYGSNGMEKITAEEYLQNIAKTYPEIKFIYETYTQQVKEWNITKLPVNAISCAGIIASYIPELLDLCMTGIQDAILKEDAIDSYVRYVPHIYRTLKISTSLSTSKDVIRELDKIVTNVPKIMNKDEVNEFMKLLDII